MDALWIEGPARLSGAVEVSKAKNAYLPILAATLLNDEDVFLVSPPRLRDIATMNTLLTYLGGQITAKEMGCVYNASKVHSCKATYELVKTMRASICVLGPLLGKHRHAKVSLPGGCAIGTRPIDLHLKGLEQLGADIRLRNGYVEARARSGLHGAKILLDFPSVGATENIMMAAVLAKGKTIIKNCALEPEVTDLARFLKTMGARISGEGTRTLTIEGVSSLHGGEYSPIGDRIEAATYIMAGLITDSELKVSGVDSTHLEFVINLLQNANANLEIGPDFIQVKKGAALTGVSVETAPYPGLPTDLQAQLLALSTQMQGTGFITENIFENRFMHVPELKRLGAKIVLKGKTAWVTGESKLKAAPVMCTDLRASAALILAALCAEGETQINRIYHLDRGYDRLDQKLKNLGVSLRRGAA